MAALACSTYSQPAQDPQCFGDEGVQWVTLLSWHAVGIFFFCMMLSVLLIADLEGVPDEILISHLNDVELAHAAVPVLCFYGVSILAVAYGIDIVVRNGCELKLLGLVGAPILVVFMAVVWVYLRRKRRSAFRKAGLSADNLRWLVTWMDRIPTR